MRYFLELCLQSVTAALEGIPSEIIVIDNDSKDNSCAMIQTKFPNVIVIENQNNIGFSKANNQAVKQAKGEFICILNPDTVVSEDTFHKAIKFAEGKSNLGIVGCRMINGSGQFLPESKRHVPTIRIAFQKLMGFSKNYYATTVPENSSCEVDVLTGAFMLMQRELYQSLEGFDEDFFMYGEDIDLCYRVQKSGYKNYYFSDSTIIHFKGESTLKNKTYFKWFYGAMQLFHDKHFKSKKAVSFAVRIITELLPRVLPKLDLKKSNPPNSKSVSILQPHSEASWLSRIEVHSVSNTDELRKNQKIDLVLDTTCLTFKQIIHHINTYKTPNVSFKIWPKHTTYCVGSDVSNRRGEVIHFDRFEYRTYF